MILWYDCGKVRVKRSRQLGICRGEVISKDQIKQFYEQADEYCCFIAENVIAADTIPSVMELLMKLYISVMNLPETEPESIASLSEITEAVPIRFAEQIPTTYWEIFDPYADKDSVCGDLTEDLSDIAADLRNGMIMDQESEIVCLVYFFICTRK